MRRAESWGAFREVWKGAAYRKMRGQFRDDWEKIPICSRCTYAYVGGNYDQIVADAWFFDHEENG